MTVRLLPIVFLMFLARAVEATTFGEVLGRDGVIAVVRDETTTFVRQFADMTRVRPEVAPGFHDGVADRVLDIEAPEAKVAAEATLRSRFRLFLANLSGFLLATKQNLIFDVAAVNRYLQAAAGAGRCGEVPCERGCADKKPCDWRCNACPPAKAEQGGA